MKMSKELYDEMAAALSQIHTPEMRAVYLGEGFSAGRYGWDLLHAAQKRGLFATRYWVCDVLYPAGLNDVHIDTALRRFLKEVSR